MVDPDSISHIAYRPDTGFLRVILTRCYTYLLTLALVGLGQFLASITRINGLTRVAASWLLCVFFMEKHHTHDTAHSTHHTQFPYILRKKTHPSPPVYAPQPHTHTQQQRSIYVHSSRVCRVCIIYCLVCLCVSSAHATATADR